MTDHIQTIRTALQCVSALMAESDGVTGFHLNGAVMPWSDFDSGIDAALASLTALQEERERMQADSRRLKAISDGRWCVVPPNQETEAWSVYGHFDGEFGCDNQLSDGLDLNAAIDAAMEPAPLSRMCSKCGHPNHKSRMHQDVCTFYVKALGAECGCTVPQEGRS